MTEIYTLYSSSKGNSTFFSDGKTSILIDAGRSYKKLCQGLYNIGKTINDIDAVFITHEHSDHIGAVEMICKHTDIPVHVISPCARCKKLECIYDRMTVHEPVFQVDINDVNIRSFLTSHDSCGSVGYIVTLEGEQYGLATAMGWVSPEVSRCVCQCQGVIIESNHDIDMLKKGSYPAMLKERILSRKGHLSNDACAEFLPTLAQSGVKNILLAHLSEENNTPELALNCAVCALKAHGIDNVSVNVASSNEPTKLII